MNEELAAEKLTALQKAGTIRDLENRFTCHPPKNNQAARYQIIRERALELAYWINAECPGSRELSLAFTHLEEVVFWANASIARNE